MNLLSSIVTAGEKKRGRKQNKENRVPAIFSGPSNDRARIMAIQRAGGKQARCILTAVFREILEQRYAARLIGH